MPATEQPIASTSHGSQNVPNPHHTPFRPTETGTDSQDGTLHPAPRRKPAKPRQTKHVGLSGGNETQTTQETIVPSSSEGAANKNSRARRPPVNPSAGSALGTLDQKTSAEGNTRPGGEQKRSSGHRTSRRQRPQGSTVDQGKPVADDKVNKPPDADKNSKKSANKGSRAPRFKPSLTEPSQATADHSAPVYNNPSTLQKDDLTSKLIQDLSTPPYPDCLICFSGIHPLQPTWSCSPLIPISLASDSETSKETKDLRANETAQCCWTTFHLKCIRTWASKNVKDLEQAWKARGEDRKGEWRCPGCQSKRMTVPTSYWCYCGSMPDPKPPRLATPHSCAGPCNRQRACGHPCALACHPGPCPPCHVTMQKICYCGKETLTYRCSSLAPSRSGAVASLSCGRMCNKMLACGNHQCEDQCHDGPCTPCQVRGVWKCYCGQSEKDLACGEGIGKHSIMLDASGEHQWYGRFECDKPCNRLFDCGVHHCEKRCHVPSRSPTGCPRSPSRVTHCPCGKHSLDSASTPYFPSNTILGRTACTDPIPTCESTCMKPLDGCSHTCSAKCHTGPCPLCTTVLVRPCRCGSATRDVPCHEDQTRTRGELAEILCDKGCTALRACGRHQCNRICCPLASLGSMLKGKGKKKMTSAEMDALATEAGSGWHECDLVCGKLLPCGNHHCELKDHRGACPSCLRSSFEEMFCNCGRTVLEPPIPCGTRVTCTWPCARVLQCGHPAVPHACHDNSVPCPLCPYLTEKRCACGKKVVGNVPCSQQKVSCGTPCGKLLGCGFHHCERLCHGDDCGSCHAVCGKSRKLCLPANHPCPLACHAPAACDESEPCRTPVTLTCPCGRIHQQVSCGKSTPNPAGREGSQQLKCTNECLLAKRNARLAEALGINTESRTTQATYSDELLSNAKADMKFCLLVEKTFVDFISSDKRTQVLPQMPPHRRKFVQSLATVYRMDTQMVDQEPHRSVQLIRRIDSRIPTPLLSASVSTLSTSSSTPSLGKLADLRAPVAQVPRSAAGPSRSQTSSPAPPQSFAARGWSSIVTHQPSTQPSIARNPTPARSGDEGAGGLGATAVPRNRAVLSNPNLSASNPSDAAAVPDNWEDDA